MHGCTAFASLCVLATGLLGCGGDGSATFRDRASGLALRYPRSWSVTGFSQTTSPQRLVVASYVVNRRQVEGDCGGRRALRSLPPDGAAVLVIDYGATSVFSPHRGRFSLSQLDRATYECFGETYMVRFHRGGHDLQAHVAVGAHASADRREQALAILDSFHTQ